MIKASKKKILERFSYMNDLVCFKKNKMQALIDLSSEINIITLTM